MSKLRVYLAEDHAVVRAGVKLLVNQQPDFEVVGEAANGELAVAEVVRLLPDVVVMDISMPVLSGTGATREIKRHCPAVKILGLSMTEDPVSIQDFISAGASGYVLKRAAPDELIGAIRAVHRGEMPIDARSLAQLLHPSDLGPEDSLPGPPLLTRQETSVLRAIAQGFSNKEIAASMDLSVKTVETYKARGMEKALLKNRVDLVRYANGRGWLQE